MNTPDEMIFSLRVMLGDYAGIRVDDSELFSLEEMVRLSERLDGKPYRAQFEEDAE